MWGVVGCEVMLLYSIQTLEMCEIMLFRSSRGPSHYCVIFSAVDAHVAR